MPRNTGQMCVCASIREVSKFSQESMLSQRGRAIADASCLSALMHVLCLKNAPTLASLRFDNYGLTLIIFGEEYQHSFNKKPS